MKCYQHNVLDAVATCQACGRGLCVECSDVFQPPFCSGCGEEAVKNHAEEVMATRSSMKFSAFKAGVGILWNGFFLFAGLVLACIWYSNGLSWGEIIVNLIICWGVSGLPWVLTQGLLSNKGSTTVVMDTQSWLIGSVIGFILKLVMGFLIGAVASPVLFVASIYKFRKSLAGMKEASGQVKPV